jgi:RNA polymerase sigma-70 factor (ECF subfamily)
MIAVLSTISTLKSETVADAAPTRVRLNGFLQGVERRALRMAELAVRQRDDALELVQEAMMSFVRSYGSKPEAEWPPLFWRVVDSKIQDHHRRFEVRSRWRVFFSARDENEGDALADLPDPRAVEPGETLGAEQSGRAIEAALRALPDRQRQAFLLRQWEGLDVADTARAMGCSEGSVKTHLFRALENLRGQLRDHR